MMRYLKIMSKDIKYEMPKYIMDDNYIKHCELSLSQQIINQKLRTAIIDNKLGDVRQSVKEGATNLTFSLSWCYQLDRSDVMRKLLINNGANIAKVIFNCY